ncbi:unnamed protein product, partial [Laminaria digitata]
PDGPAAPGAGAPSPVVELEAPGDAPLPSRATVKVTFTSQPSGASVFDAHGLSLGRTPLTTRLPRPKDSAKTVPFLFKLKGHAEETRQVALEGDELDISVKLRSSTQLAP